MSCFLKICWCLQWCTQYWKWCLLWNNSESLVCRSRFQPVFMFWARFWSPLCLEGRSRVGTSDLSSSRLSSHSLSLPPPVPPRPSCKPSQPGVNQGAAAGMERGTGGRWREGWTTERQAANGRTYKPANTQTDDEWFETGHSVVRSRPSPPRAPMWDDHNTNMWDSPAVPQAAGRHLHKAAPVLAWLTLTWGSMWDRHSLLLPPLLLFLTSLSLTLSGRHRKTAAQTSRPTPSVYHGALDALWSVSLQSNLATLPP